MPPTLTAIRSHSSVTRWREAVMRVARACRAGGVRGPSDDELQRLLEGLIVESREAGSEAGTWDLPDSFLETVEPRLRTLVRRGPRALELAPAHLAAQLGALTQECRRVEADGVGGPAPESSGLAVGRARTAGLLACAVIAVVALSLQGVSRFSAGLIGTAGLVGSVAGVEILARWARGRLDRQRARRLRLLRAEFAGLEAELRRTALACARVDQWVATYRQLVEAEYRWCRARAARVMAPILHSTASGPRALPEPPDALSRALLRSRVGS